MWENCVKGQQTLRWLRLVLVTCGTNAASATCVHNESKNRTTLHREDGAQHSQLKPQRGDDKRLILSDPQPDANWAPLQIPSFTFLLLQEGRILAPCCVGICDAFRFHSAEHLSVKLHHAIHKEIRILSFHALLLFFIFCSHRSSGALTSLMFSTQSCGQLCVQTSSKQPTRSRSGPTSPV